MIVAILVVAFYVLAALCIWAVIAIDGKPVVWPAAIDILKALGATWLIFECWTLFGMALAFLFRQSAMAIGLGLAYVLAIEGILFRALSGFNLSWLTTVEKFFVGQNANALTGSFGSAIATRGTQAPAVSAEQAVLVLAGYALAFIVLTAAVIRTRDVA